MDDYYDLLDVAPDAERDDIRSAYRAKRDELVAADAEQNKGAVAKLNRAWNVLSDPAQRERYDERLAEQRDSGDIDTDDEEDERPRRPAPRKKSSAPQTRAEERAEARRARAERRPTITLPDGLTMAPNRVRFSALGFDLMVLLLIFLSAYFGGLKLVDNHFPGQQKLGRDLLSQERKVATKVNDDKKAASDADKAAAAAKVKHDTAAEAKAKANAAAARAQEAADQKVHDTLNAQVEVINKRIGPWLNLTFFVGAFLVLLYLVPSTAVSGQTLGKRLRGIRVVHLDGSRPGLKTALLRFGVPLLISTILGVFLGFGPYGLAVGVIGMVGWVTQPNRQGLHDRLAKTVVVEA